MGFSNPLVTFEISRKCNAYCDHCVTLSGPQYKESLSFEKIKKIINETSTISDSICFSGGEPFLFLEKLKYGIECAKGLNLSVSIVTNAFWASSTKKARKVLTYIGNDIYIEISYNSLQIQYVPFENIINAAKACSQLGLDVCIRSLHIGFKEKNKLQNLEMMEKKFSALPENIKLDSRPLSLTGRATTLDKKKHDIKIVSELPGRNTCSALEVIFISYLGEIYPCCGGLISVIPKNKVVIGNINEKPLKIIYNKAKDSFYLNFLNKYGASRLLELLEYNTDLSFPTIKKLASNIQKDDGCQLCSRIFSTPEMYRVLNDGN